MNIIQDIIIVVMSVSTIVYFVSFLVHIQMTKEHAKENDLELKKINFHKFKKLFHQYLWKRGDDRGSFFPFKDSGYKEFHINYIHADIVAINGIGYRLKWYSWLSFMIWRQLKYKPNKNLMMAYL